MNVYETAEYGIGIVGGLLALVWVAAIAFAIVNGDLELTAILVGITVLMVYVAVGDLLDL